MQTLLPHILFYVFAGLTVLTAILVITQNNPVRCVLFLVLTFFSSSILWILSGAEFLALILVLVYVGAVMTLFLFVVMMLNVDIESIRTNFKRYILLGLVIVTLMVTLLLVAINAISVKTGNKMLDEVKPTRVEDFQLPMRPSETKKTSANTKISNTEALGLVLYTDYLYAFEMAAVILLVAIVASITLVHRKPRHSKQQNIIHQIMTNKDDRLTLVKMNPETRESSI